MINLQDRKDYLLDTGVSPGEDDNYDTQLNNLLDQKAYLNDNAKQNIFQRISTLIGTARHAGAPGGPPNPGEFIEQVLGKSVPTPNELNPINLIKGFDVEDPNSAIRQLASGALEVGKHPLASLKQAVLNPPEPSTIAALMLPGAALKAYRELTPLAARTYLHHMAGISTPFTHVTETERKVLTKLAQDKIDKLLEIQIKMDKSNMTTAAHTNNLRFMPEKDLLDYAAGLNLDVPDVNLDNLTQPQINQIRKTLVAQYKGTWRGARKVLKDDTDLLGEPMDNENVRKDYQEVTGKQLKGFQMWPVDQGVVGRERLNLTNALGKTYVEPTIQQTGQQAGRIVPKAIHDTYKFYPDVYNYGVEDGILNRVKSIIRFNTERGRYNFKNLPDLISMNSNDPLGILARKLAFGRPTTIIDIPLTKAAPLNAYDKAAILLGGKQLAGERK